MRTRLSRIGLLLGSNIEPEVYLPLALKELGGFFTVLAVSNAWQTPSAGAEGPDFINAAVLIHAAQEPHFIKEQVLRPIESRLGRIRGRDKFAPRTIDIDLVSAGDRTIDSNLWRFAHVAVPLAELLPDIASAETGERLESTARRLLKTTPMRIRPEVFVQSSAPGKLLDAIKPLELRTQ